MDEVSRKDETLLQKLLTGVQWFINGEVKHQSFK